MDSQWRLGLGNDGDLVDAGGGLMIEFKLMARGSLGSRLGSDMGEVSIVKDLASQTRLYPG